MHLQRPLGIVTTPVMRLFTGLFVLCLGAASAGAAAPSPMVDQNHRAEWVFAFKFNAGTFPTTATLSSCLFGGDPQSYASSQRYVFASKAAPELRDGPGLIGTSTSDPVGATFAKIYAAGLNFVVWNDQFYRHPAIAGCSESCSGPWGHSKGVLAWDGQGRGVVVQVTTPSWPGSGTAAAPRASDGNTLGCVDDDNVKASQHFFALRLTPADTAAVLDALANASVVTDLANPQLARLGGPPELEQRARLLGRKSASVQVLDVMLSSGVRLISKPSALHVPPWQMLSALLGGTPLRAATWWASPRIPTTVAGQTIICWSDGLGAPGAVDIAASGAWAGRRIGLQGGPQPDANHAKVGVSIGGAHHYAIFADLNQQGRLTGKCDSSQNGRGGLFFVVDDPALHASLSALIAGDTASTAIPVTGMTSLRPNR
jgi:hypothetical protein